MAKINFTNSVLKILKDNGLSEGDVIDAYNHGEYSKMPDGGNKVIKVYHSYGYELGLFYITGKHDDVVITYVWKRERR